MAVSSWWAFLPIVIRVKSSEWCSVSYEVLGDTSGYEVEARDIRELGLHGKTGERVDTGALTQIPSGSEVVLIVECEFDAPHVVAISPRDRKIIHYSLLASNPPQRRP